MVKQFEKLTDKQKDILLKAPVLMSILSASWDHEISRKERAAAIELEHIKTFSSSPLLIPYYKEVEKRFTEYFDEALEKYAPFDTEKREALEREIGLVNTVINKLDKEYARELHVSLMAYAKQVKMADKNSLLMNFVLPVPIHGFTD